MYVLRSGSAQSVGSVGTAGSVRSGSAQSVGTAGSVRSGRVRSVCAEVR